VCVCVEGNLLTICNKNLYEMINQVTARENGRTKRNENVNRKTISMARYLSLDFYESLFLLLFHKKGSKRGGWFFSWSQHHFTLKFMDLFSFLSRTSLYVLIDWNKYTLVFTLISICCRFCCIKTMENFFITTQTRGKKFS
jgi:hypothetical protein